MKSVCVDSPAPGFNHVKVVDAEKPTPARGQVLVRMRFSPINPSDHNYVHGTYADALARMIWNAPRTPLTPETSPLTPEGGTKYGSPSVGGGGELAQAGGEPIYFDPARTEPIAIAPYALGGEGMGIVEASGGGFLANRLVGKRVAVVAGPPLGAWQEYTVVDAKRALPLPGNVSDEQGSMYFINPLTAYAMLFSVLEAKPGEWVLQSGASGALGKLVIRMAKLGGLKTINVVRSAAAAQSVLELGGDVAVDVSKEDLREAVIKATRGQGVRCAVDCIGGEMTSELVRCLTRGGHCVVYGTLGTMTTNLPLRDLMMPGASLSGFFLPAWLATQSLFGTIKTLRKVGKLLASGGFDTAIGAVYPLDEVQTALAASQDPGKPGKVLLRI
jgi:NADPH:quinone reductase-like Zn-dependent oxidoreductase